jgi:hypothetical protein
MQQAEQEAQCLRLLFRVPIFRGDFIRYLNVLSVALAVISVSCGAKTKAKNPDSTQNALLVGCDSLEGEYVMGENSCEGYYSTLLPKLGRTSEWITLSAGDTVKIEQKSCESVRIGSSKSEGLEDFSPGVKLPKSDGYSGSISRSLLSRDLIVKESKSAQVSHVSRTIGFSLDKDKNLVIDLDSTTRGFILEPIKLKSKCTLKRVAQRN